MTPRDHCCLFCVILSDFTPTSWVGQCWRLFWRILVVLFVNYSLRCGHQVFFFPSGFSAFSVCSTVFLAPHARWDFFVSVVVRSCALRVWHSVGKKYRNTAFFLFFFPTRYWVVTTYRPVHDLVFCVMCGSMVAFRIFSDYFYFIYSACPQWSITSSVIIWPPKGRIFVWVFCFFFVVWRFCFWLFQCPLNFHSARVAVRVLLVWCGWLLLRLPENW